MRTCFHGAGWAVVVGGLLASTALAEPTDEEQYFLCLVNRARSNPTAEAKRLGIDLNEGLKPGTISPAPKQPLTVNLKLLQAARGHSQWMIDHGQFAHEEGPHEKTPGERMKAAGYVFTAPYGNGENIGFTGQSDGYAPVQAAAEELYRGLFVDAGVADRGHRTNILHGGFRESGVGLLKGMVKMKEGELYSWLLTQDFAYTAGNAFVTGVVYSDTVKVDGFYTPGEGLGEVTITATGQGGVAKTTKTWRSGGYTLELAPGMYRITASGGKLAGKMDGGMVKMGKENVEVDFKAGAGSGRR